MNFEDLEISKKAEKIGKQYLKGKITANEAIRMIKKLHKVGGNQNV